MFGHRQLSRFVRFSIVGLIFLGLGALMLYVLVECLNLGYLLAYIVSFLALNLGSYAINKRFSFRLDTALRGVELVRYYLVALLGLFFGMAMMWGLVELAGIHYLPASIFVGFLCAVFNYAGHVLFTFGRMLRRRHAKRI